MSPMMLLRTFFLACPSLFLLLDVPANGQDANYAQEVMQKYGLTKSGGFWLLPAEADLAKQATALPALEKKFIEESKRYFDYLARLKEANKVYNAAVAEYEKISPLTQQPNAPPAAIARHNQLVTIIKQLEPSVVNLEMQDLNNDYQTLSIAASEARNAIVLPLVGILENSGALDKQYAELKTNEEVQAALKILSPIGQKLGPAKSYKLPALKQKQLEQAVLGPNHILTRDDDHLVVYGLVNESKAMPLSWSYDIEPSFIQQRDLDRIGIKIPDDAPTGTLSTEQAKYKTKVTKLSFRFGKHVLRDVEVLVLGPEAKEFGNLIGSKALGEMKFSRDPREFNAVILGPNEEPPAPPGAKGRK